MKACTISDFDKFWPVNENQKVRVEKLKTDGSLQCIDWSNEDIKIWGTEASGNSGLIDVIAMPCHVRETMIGGTEDRIPADCERNIERYREYLGPGQDLVAYHNQQAFHIDEYGELRVTEHSFVSMQQLETLKPTWVATIIS